MTSHVIRHEGAKVTTVAARIDRLGLAPDDHSDAETEWRHPDIGLAPLKFQGGSTPWSGARSTLNPYEGADMAKNTWGTPPLDSRTCDTGVKITPPTHAGPVTTTQTTR